jgi:hypothetical protein
MAFSDDHILYESLDSIMEAPFSKVGRTVRAAYVGAKSSAKKEWETPDANPSARARRAERASAIRGALRGAKEGVKGALHRTHQKVTDMRSQMVARGKRLANKISRGALRAQAALSKVGRTARAAYAGAKSSAKKEWETPSKAPSSRIPGKQRTQQVRAAAKREMGDVFAKDTKYERPGIEKLRSAARKAKEGQTVHGGPAPKPPGLPKKRVPSPDPWKEPAKTYAVKKARVSDVTPPRKALPPASPKKRVPSPDPWKEPAKTYAVKKARVSDVTPSQKALPSSGKTSGSTKGGRVLTASQRRMKNAAMVKRLKDDLDYDLLIQFMVEDIIDKGYAIDEEEALCMLEDMEAETFEELAEEYICE